MPARKGETWNESVAYKDAWTLRECRRITPFGEVNQTPNYHTNIGFTADSEFLAFWTLRSPGLIGGISGVFLHFFENFSGFFETAGFGEGRRRIGKRALKNSYMYLIAAAAFVAHEEERQVAVGQTGRRRLSILRDHCHHPPVPIRDPVSHHVEGLVGADPVPERRHHHHGHEHAPDRDSVKSRRAGGLSGYRPASQSTPIHSSTPLWSPPRGAPPARRARCAA